jgi:hypothetical protein
MRNTEEHTIAGDTLEDAGGQPSQADADGFTKSTKPPGTGTQVSVPADLTIDELPKSTREINSGADAAMGWLRHASW